jgi:hypothetical protein
MPAHEAATVLQDPLAELNGEIVEVLAGGSAGLQWQWRALGEAARVRLARCPFLLADAGFGDPRLWTGLPGAGVHEALPPASAESQRCALPTPLLRRVLLYAWHLTRVRPLSARMTLGMCERCLSVVAACRLADLEALAERRPPWIRARWVERPGLWRSWLTAAAQESPLQLELLQLWGLQMIAAEVVRHDQ